MSESCKCPKCSELLNRGSVLHHLCVDHQMSMRDAVRWAGLHVDAALLGGGDGMGQSGYTQKGETSTEAKP